MVILKIGHHLSQKQPTNKQKTNIQTELLWKFYLGNLGMFYLNWKNIIVLLWLTLVLYLFCHLLWLICHFKILFYFNELYLKLKSGVKCAILVNIFIALFIILLSKHTYCIGLQKVLKLFLRKHFMLIDNGTILVLNIIPRLTDFSNHDKLCKFLA